MPDGGFLALNVTKQRLYFFHPDEIGLSPAEGFFKVPLERGCLDFQYLEAPQELAGGRQADLFDYLFEILKSGFSLDDFFRKQRRIFIFSIHDS